MVAANSNLPPEPVQNTDVEYFQTLADGAPVMIWMSGSDMGCFYFNRAWLDYRGRTLAQEFGNGWAEGVHPEDMERCVKHYISCFERRIPFAMSYRLQHYSGEYRWILDRGAPHYASDGGFLGFYGGCAEMCSDVSVPRVTELRQVLGQMRDFADRLAATEAQAAGQQLKAVESHKSKTRLQLERVARQHAAIQIGRLAADMITFDRIPNGACIH